MVQQGRNAAQEDAHAMVGEASAAPSRPAAATSEPETAARVPREPFGTRISPSLHLWLKRDVLRLQEELGRRAKIESVVEALLLEYQADPDLRARVQERVRRE